MRLARTRILVAALTLLLFGRASPPARANTDTARHLQWGLEAVRAPQAWSIGRGAGTTIAVLDTGVDLAHEDLASKLLPGRSFVDAPVQDDRGHGSHVAGIAAAATDNGRGIAGVAPDTKILPIRVLGSDGGGTNEEVARGIRFAADQRATVINLSLGPEVPLVFSALDDSLVRAIDYAWAKGSVVVIAAGNNFVPLSEYDNVKAIVVAAVDRNDRRASYSTGVGGAMWSMAAPGGASGTAAQGVLSTYWEEGKSNSYAFLAGTSMATPHVAGAAAVLRGLGLTPQQTVDRLLSTAKDLGPAGKDNDFGSGRLDLAAAVAGLGPAPAPAKATGSGGSATTRPAGRSSTPPTAASPTAPPGPDSASLPTTPPGAEGQPPPGSTAGQGSTDFTPIEVEEAETAAAPELGNEEQGDAGGVPLFAVLLAVGLLAGIGAYGIRRLRRAP
ncbi:MAG: S8 family serine peptidase [Acidimicrobiia bacterium]